MEIKRDLYLNKLISKKHNSLIKVITGIRRCGKSFLLFTLFKNHLLENGIKEDYIIEMSFDTFENKKYRNSECISHMVTPLKYYFTDIGLRNARINFRQTEETHTMEN